MGNNTTKYHIQLVREDFECLRHTYIQDSDIGNAFCEEFQKLYDSYMVLSDSMLSKLSDYAIELQELPDLVTGASAFAAARAHINDDFRESAIRAQKLLRATSAQDCPRCNLTIA